MSAPPARDLSIRLSAPLVGGALRAFARLVTGVRGRSVGPRASGPAIYFANHASHGDFVLIWTVLPPHLRATTRPVAGNDYWSSGRVRPWIARHVLDAVLVDRGKLERTSDPIAPVRAALDAGSSVIIFPEGTRNQTDAALLAFKSGLYRLAVARPDIPLVPVWIENTARVMPKGEWLPIPLLCSVTFGPAIRFAEGETRPAFLARAAGALLALRPQESA